MLRASLQPSITIERMRSTSKATDKTAPRKNRTDRANLATAFHEAGHAIAALALGIRIRSVSIEPGDDYHGVCGLDTRLRVSQYQFTSPGPKGRDTLRRHIIISLAGPVAQRKHRPSSIRSFHATSDYSDAVTLAEFAEGSVRATNLYLEYLLAVAEDFVDGNWIAVERLARALLQEKTISGARAYEIRFQAFRPQ